MPRRKARATRTGRAAALNDLTGYWVSVVTEDWRLRMIVPDPQRLPDPSAQPPRPRKWPTPGIRRRIRRPAISASRTAPPRSCAMPGRLHIHWQDDNTLRIDTDSGTQTRLLHFGGAAPPDTAPEWQGYSVAVVAGTEADFDGWSRAPAFTRYPHRWTSRTWTGAKTWPRVKVSSK